MERAFNYHIDRLALAITNANSFTVLDLRNETQRCLTNAAEMVEKPNNDLLAEMVNLSELIDQVILGAGSGHKPERLEEWKTGALAALEMVRAELGRHQPSDAAKLLRLE